MPSLRFCFAKPQSRASPYRKSSKHSKNCKPFFGCPDDFRHGSCLTRKRKALCTQFMCKGRMSRGTTFSCKASLRISFFCNGKSRPCLLRRTSFQADAPRGYSGALCRCLKPSGSSLCASTPPTCPFHRIFQLQCTHFSRACQEIIGRWCTWQTGAHTARLLQSDLCGGPAHLRLSPSAPRCSRPP